jgi:hypothetical protein
MHKSTILQLLSAIQTTPVYYLEEVYITGILRDKAGLIRKTAVHQVVHLRLFSWLVLLYPHIAYAHVAMGIENCEQYVRR